MTNRRALLYFLIGFILAFGLSWVGNALAAAFTVNFTAAQDTQLQTKMIPLVNTAKCAGRGLASNCTSANLVTAGCVAVAFPTVGYNTCTIYTLDVAGETAFLQDELNARLMDRFTQLNVVNTISFSTACKALTLTQQNTLCTDAGLASGCNPCP